MMVASEARRGLMAADLQPVDALAQMVGVVDGPARQPQHLALERAEDVEVVALVRAIGALEHRRKRLRDGYLRFSVAMLVFLSAASSTPLQAGGKSASMVCRPGGPGFLGGMTLSENQKSSSLGRHPSLPDTGSCALHCGESAGHLSRT